VAIIQSAQQRSIKGDYSQDSDYRDANTFFYLTGIEAPGAALVLALASVPDRQILCLAARHSGGGRAGHARLTTSL
jgi:hypothetical protein